MIDDLLFMFLFNFWSSFFIWTVYSSGLYTFTLNWHFMIILCNLTLKVEEEFDSSLKVINGLKL